MRGSALRDVLERVLSWEAARSCTRLRRRLGPEADAGGTVPSPRMFPFRPLTDDVDTHANSLGVKTEGALPGGPGVTTRVVGLQLREGVHEVGLADGAQDAGHDDIGRRELGTRDPFAIFEATLDALEPAAGEL